MKIYFCGSIRAGREDHAVYFAIIQELKKYGKVLTEHIGDIGLSINGEDKVTDDYIYKRDMAWLESADLIVAEVTIPSLGVGYEIGQAQAMGKPIICLYRKTAEKRLSGMIAGNSYCKKVEYRSVLEIGSILNDLLKKELL